MMVEPDAMIVLPLDGATALETVRAATALATATAILSLIVPLSDMPRPAYSGPTPRTRDRIRPNGRSHVHELHAKSGNGVWHIGGYIRYTRPHERRSDLEAKCPHCGKSIEVVSAKELGEEFGINSNRLQHAKSKDRFPEPWLNFPNRDIYLREDVVAFQARESTRGAEQHINTLKTLLADMSPEDASRLLEELSGSMKS